MQSNGGFAGPEATSQFPVRMVESGPAAGTISAIFHGRRAGYDRLVSFDMGGTTAKIAVLTGETPPLVNELEVARVHRFKAGSGMPLRCPSVALNEIGAGGGSIASIDGVGLMRVGPRARARRRGRFATAQGGNDPTVTDADLILGYLDPDYFAGGSMRLDKAAAESAIRDKLSSNWPVARANRLGHPRHRQSEHGERRAAAHPGAGRGPATFAMVAFGGAGPGARASRGAGARHPHHRSIRSMPASHPLSA